MTPPTVKKAVDCGRGRGHVGNTRLSGTAGPARWCALKRTTPKGRPEDVMSASEVVPVAGPAVANS